MRAWYVFALELVGVRMGRLAVGLWIVAFPGFQKSLPLPNVIKYPFKRQCQSMYVSCIYFLLFRFVGALFSRQMLTVSTFCKEVRKRNF